MDFLVDTTCMVVAGTILWCQVEILRNIMQQVLSLITSSVIYLL
jgi:hypothetical protein